MSTPDDPGSGTVLLLLDSSGIGGIERHVTILARGLTERGVSNQILLLQDHGETAFTELLTKHGLPYAELDGAWKSLRNALSTIKPRLVHTHGYKAGIMGRLAARRARIPCVSTFHAGERAPFPVSVYQAIDEWTATLGTSIAVSGKIAESLPFGATLIPNFVETPRAPNLSPLPRRVSFVGRMSQEKGPDLFCKVARASRSAVEFHAYGDGPMRAELESRYGGCVRFHGVVTDMQEVWRNTGLLLMTSRAEGLPMAALEALSAGIPLACSRVGDLPLLVQEDWNGWTFDPADIDGATRAVASWLLRTETSHAALRENAWARASKFNVAPGVTAVCEVYARATGRPITTTVQSSTG